jgi:hypothetical protein
MATTEHTINDALAGVLRETRRQGAWFTSGANRASFAISPTGSPALPHLYLGSAHTTLGSGFW